MICHRIIQQKLSPSSIFHHNKQITGKWYKTENVKTRGAFTFVGFFSFCLKCLDYTQTHNESIVQVGFFFLILPFLSVNEPCFLAMHLWQYQFSVSAGGTRIPTHTLTTRRDEWTRQQSFLPQKKIKVKDEIVLTSGTNRRIRHIQSSASRHLVVRTPGRSRSCCRTRPAFISYLYRK